MNKKITILAIALSFFSGIANADLNFGEDNKDTNDKYKVGVDYEIIKPAINNSDHVGEINVINFFSYGCLPCVDTTKKMEEWKIKMPYYAQMNNSPVAPTISSSYPARIYFTLEKLDRLDLNMPFLEESSNGKTDFSKFNILTSWFDGRGIKTDDFKKGFDSNEVVGKVYSSPNVMKIYGIESIPTITVAGKYKITAQNINSHKEDLKDLVTFLVEKAREKE